MLREDEPNTRDTTSIYPDLTIRTSSGTCIPSRCNRRTCCRLAEKPRTKIFLRLPVHPHLSGAIFSASHPYPFSAAGTLWHFAWQILSPSLCFSSFRLAHFNLFVKAEQVQVRIIYRTCTRFLSYFITALSAECSSVLRLCTAGRTDHRLFSLLRNRPLHIQNFNFPVIVRNLLF